MRRVLLLIVAVLLICTFAEQSAVAEDGLIKKDLADSILSVLSGEAAHDQVTKISRFDRIQGSRGMRAASEYVVGQLEKWGLKGEIYTCPSDGDRYYGSFRSVVGWWAEEGEIWMVKPKLIKLGDYSEMPLYLVKHSGSGDITAELVDVGSGLSDRDYEGLDVAGKIVLAGGYTQDVHRLACDKYNAAGIVTWYPPEVREGYPEMVRYTAIWPRLSESESVRPAFNVSKRDGLMLRNYLEEGQKVVIRMRAKTEFHEGELHTVSCRIEGSELPEEEIIIAGHLDHPKPCANDNASGAAGMLEMARVLKRLIDIGEIPGPRRSIRFLWLTEFNGTIPYLIDNPELCRNALAAFNLDMIGEKYIDTGAVFEASRSAGSQPSYFNDLVENVIEQTARLNPVSLRGTKGAFLYRMIDFRHGSDHVVFNDSSFGIPSMMFNHSPDLFHHTSIDTPDKVDPSELRRVCFVTLAATLYMADAGESEARELALEVASRARARIAKDVRHRERQLLNAAFNDRGQLLEHAYRTLSFSSQRERDAIQSVLELEQNSESLKKLVTTLQNGIDAYCGQLKAELDVLAADIGCESAPGRFAPMELRQVAEAIIPTRSEQFKGPLGFDYLLEKMGLEAAESVPWIELSTVEMVNFIDGKRSAFDIWEAVTAELELMELQKVLDMLDILEDAGLITIKK